MVHDEVKAAGASCLFSDTHLAELHVPLIGVEYNKDEDGEMTLGGTNYDEDYESSNEEEYYLEGPSNNYWPF